MRTIFLILTLFMELFAIQLPVGSGRTYTDIASAMSIARSPDTIILYDSLNTITEKIGYYDGVTLMSAPGHVYRVTSSNNSAFGGYDTRDIVVERIHWGYDNTTLTSDRYFFEFEGSMSNCTWRECVFDSSAVSKSMSGAIRLTGTNNTSNRFVKCVFNGAYMAHDARNTVLDTCVIYGIPFQLYKSAKMRDCIVHFTGSGAELRLQSDSIKVTNTFIKGGYGGETVTSDEITAQISYDTLDNIVIDSSDHTTIIDGMVHGKIRKIQFVRAYGSVDIDWDQQTSDLATDLIDDLLITNSTVSRRPIFSETNNFVHNHIVMDSILHISSEPKAAWANSTNDTLKNSSFSYTPDSLSTWSYTTNIKTGVRQSWLTDTIYKFRKFKYSDSIVGGARKTLFDTYSTSVSTDTLKVVCKLSSDFKFDNRVYILNSNDKYWLKNSWWTGDTAKVYLYTSSDSNGTYTVRDSTLVYAGQTANLKYKGSGSTTYYVKTIVKGISLNATGVVDTTLYSKLTTLQAKLVYPSGTKVVRTITINHSQVSETSDHFLYQIKVPMDAKLRANIDSAKNVCVIDSGTTTYKPKWVVVPAAKDTLILYLDAAKSTTVDKKYQLCAGKNVNVLNSASAFTNCGIDHALMMDEQTGATIAVDPAGGANGTVVSPATLGNTGLFGSSAAFTNSTSRITLSTPLVPVTDITVSFITYITSSPGGIGRVIDNGKFFAMASISKISVYSNGSTAVLSNTTDLQNQWVLTTITRTSAGITNIYINGQLSGASNQSSGTPATGTTNLTIGNIYTGERPLVGKIDNIIITGSVQSSGTISDQYKMLFTPNTFSTIGPTVSVGVEKNKSKMHNGLGLF